MSQPLSGRIASGLTRRFADLVRQQYAANGPVALVPATIVARREEHRQQLSLYRQHLSGVVSQCMETHKCCAAFGEYDFINKTSHGKRAMAKTSNLIDQIADANTVLGELLSLETRLDRIRDEADLAPYAAFDATVQAFIARSKVMAQEIGSALENAVEFEAVKAIIRADPHYDHKALEAGVVLANQAVGAVTFIGTSCGLVPSPYTKPVCIGLNTAARTLNILIAVAARQAKAKLDEGTVEEYRKSHAKAAIWDAHDQNPALMAQMLCDKFIADVDIALVCADAAVGVLVDLLTLAEDPGIAGYVWSAARITIRTTLKSYAKEKVNLLQEQLGKAPDRNAFRKAGLGFWEEIKGQLLSSLTNALDPIGLAAKGLYAGACRGIASQIMRALPIEPSQAVNGADLQQQLFALADARAGDLPRRDEAQEARLDLERVGNWVPVGDIDGNRVELVLSEVQQDDRGHFRRVRIGGQIGKLHHDGLVFTADAADATDLTIAGRIPTNDSKGRPVNEVDFDLGFNPKPDRPVPSGITGNHFWVRIGNIWGYIDTNSRKFWPADVHITAYGFWRNRVIDSDGYHEGETFVKGKWYQPFAYLPECYLFAADNGLLEWARKSDNTGSGSGAEHVIGSRVRKISNGFDLTRL